MGCAWRSLEGITLAVCFTLTACGAERDSLTTVSQDAFLTEGQATRRLTASAIFDSDGGVLLDDAAQLLAVLNLPSTLNDEIVLRDATQRLLRVDIPGDRIQHLPSLANADVARPADVLDLADVAVVLASFQLDEASRNEATIALRASKLLDDAGFTASDVRVIPGAATPSPAPASPTIVWVNAASGNWSEPTNWSENRIPEPTDVVEIDLPNATPKIAIDTSVTIRSLTSSEPIEIVARKSLTVTSGASVLRGQLTLEPGTTIGAFGSDASFTATGAIAWDGASAIAFNGGKIRLPATAYTGGAETSFLRAEGTGSAIDLSALDTLSGSSSSIATNVIIEALNGGAIDLSNLTAITDNNRNGDGGGVSIRATGAASAIDLSALVSVVESNSTLSAGSGSTIETPQLTDLDGVAVIIPTEPGTLDTSQIETLTNGRLEAVGTASADFSGLISASGSDIRLVLGGAIALPNLSTIDRAGFFINGASQLSLPSAIAYDAGNETIRNPVFDVISAGGELDLSALTTLIGPDDSSELFTIRASGGGKIDLSNVTQLLDGGAGSTSIQASSAGSVVNFSALERITENGVLQVSTSGAIEVPNLVDLAPEVDILNDGTGSISLP